MKMSDLLLKYRTDKNLGAVESGKGHLYGAAYDKIFSKLDKTSELNILEIGVFKGGSLLAWKEFFPNSAVTGVDIVDAREKEFVSEKVRFILSDIKAVDQEKTFGRSKLDIVIDDGSHFIEDVLFVVRDYLGRLNNNGLLIIEDVQLPAIWGFRILREIVKQKSGCFELQYKDLRKKGLFDDFLFIVKRKNDTIFSRIMFFFKNHFVILWLAVKDLITIRDLKKEKELELIIKKIDRILGRS